MRPGLPPERDPRLYAREIRYVDDELRSLFATLVELDLDERTIFVVTSDHGDEFLEHGYWGHGAHVHAEITRVPLLIRGPGIPRGLRVARPVSHIDLMPTLLDLAGAPPVAGGMGHSFADVLRGSAPDPGAAQRPVYSEAWYPRGRTPEAFVAIEQPTLSVRVGDRKLIRFRRDDRFSYAYYDLAADPEERIDRYADHPEAARDLRTLLDAYAERARAMRSARERAPGAPGAVPVTLDPEREEKLRALGYVE
jgi:arylsulfatase A-like enzyme